MEKLQLIKEQMESLNISYELGEWTSTLSFPFWVGEYTETPTGNEDGSIETAFILTGTTNGDWIELEDAKKAIRKQFSPCGGLRVATGAGAIAVYYDSAMPVPTGDAKLKRMQINLTMKEWRNDV